MKIVLILITIAMFSACAPKNASNPEVSAPAIIPDTNKTLTCSDYAGVYDNQLFFGETLTIQNDCTFTDSICGYQAGFTLPSENETSLTVINTNGTPGCMSNSTHTCILSFNGDDLAVVCDDLIQNNQHTMSFDKR